MRKAYSYIRFSHPDQAKGDSIRRQTQRTDDFVSRNNLVLDDSERMTDKGTSAFLGEHRNNPDRHALAAFLERVRAGKIQPDSFLIIENLDRLSREDISPALSLFLEILNSKINIVQLEPETIYHHDNIQPMNIMMAIMELSRGHSESAMKSDRVGRAWGNKKANAGTKKVTRQIPRWIDPDTWEAKPEATETVKRIFKMAIDGKGTRHIANKLNKEKIPAIGSSGVWSYSYITKILNSRSVLGEYQPMKGRKNKRKADGEVVTDYFPRVIDDATFYAAQHVIRGRKNETGPAKPEECRNLFQGLLKDARDKCSMTYRSFGGPRPALPSLMSYKGSVGQGTAIGFPYAVFEQTVLKTLREIKPADLTPGEDAAIVVEALAGQLQAKSDRLDKLQAKIEAGEDLDIIIAAARNLAKEKEELTIKLREATAKVSNRDSETLGEVKTLMGVGVDRRKLRAKLKSLVSEMWAVFSKDGAERFAVVQMFFRSGAARLFLIKHTPAIQTPDKDVKAETTSITATSATGVIADLRKNWEWTTAVLEDLFPPLCFDAANISELDGTLAQKVATWAKVTGRSRSDYFRQLREAKARGYSAKKDGN
jgi:DNA invertase Pin-like site-specific DNA recombinase